MVGCAATGVTTPALHLVAARAPSRGVCDRQWPALRLVLIRDGEEAALHGRGCQPCDAVQRGTIFTCASFSCASTSEGTSLSPKPSAHASTSDWCVASPMTVGTPKFSAMWV
jgi:hypothetical protein